MKKEISIQNIWQASFILMEGEALIRTSQEGQRISFVFRDHPAVHKKLSDFLTDKATVCPQKYISFYQYLKSLVYETKRKMK